MVLKSCTLNTSTVRAKIDSSRSDLRFKYASCFSLQSSFRIKIAFRVLSDNDRSSSAELLVLVVSLWERLYFSVYDVPIVILQAKRSDHFWLSENYALEVEYSGNCAGSRI